MSNSSSASMTGNHALVVGASGICGWATVHALLHDYPTSDAFHRVTALTNRPLDPDAMLWPPSSKLQHVSGVDLLQGSQAGLEQRLKDSISAIESVTVVYFMAYCFHEDAKKETELNTLMLERAVTALDHLSPRLSFVVLTLGVKQYGVHLLDQFPWRNTLPLREDHPPIPEPHLSDLFYTHQLNFLNRASAHKQWTFCSVWPDIIIGYVPTTTFYCLPQNVAVYLSLYREIHGAGAEVVFPGTKSWTIKSNDSSQDTIARFTIHASLHRELSAAQGFNTADNASWSTWSVKWPILCDYFGLKGVPPIDGEQGPQPGPDPDGFVAENQDRWVDMERKYGLRGGLVKGRARGVQGICHFLMDLFDYDRQLDLTKMHRAWGQNTEERDVKEAWYVAFDRFRKARMIP